MSINNKKGSEMVEASITMPILILAIILLLRLFTFYLQIISESVNSHENALRAWDSYTGKTLSVYEDNSSVEMVKGGLLGFNLKKNISSRAYFYNEDALVRMGEIVDTE